MKDAIWSSITVIVVIALIIVFKMSPLSVENKVGTPKANATQTTEYINKRINIDSVFKHLGKAHYNKKHNCIVFKNKQNNKKLFKSFAKSEYHDLKNNTNNKKITAKYDEN